MAKTVNQRTWQGTLTVVLLTAVTVPLLFVAFDQGGWWFLLLVVWLPIYYALCAWCGHPVEKGGSSAHDDFPMVED